jgi:hypothetical protein
MPIKHGFLNFASEGGRRAGSDENLGRIIASRTGVVEIPFPLSFQDKDQ